MKRLDVTVNKPLPGYSPGQRVSIAVGSDGIPLLKFWRDRLKDAEIDGCVSVSKLKSKTNSKQTQIKKEIS